MIDKNIVALNRIYEKDKLTIDWFVGKRCNYDCTYCTPDIHDNFSPHIPLENLKNSANVFLKQFDGNNIKIGFTGGEPCVHPEFHIFCKYLFENGIHRTTVTTNGTRTADYYLDLFQYVKSYTFSQHFEYAKNKDFLPKIKKINDNISCKKNIMIQVMFHADYFDEAKQAIQFYKDNNIKYSLRRIRPKNKTSMSSYNYTKEHLDWFFDNQPKGDKADPNTEMYYLEDNKVKKDLVHVNEISGSEKNNFEGWTCWAGLQHLHIWLDGTVYRGNCHVGGPIGNIMDKDFALPTDPIVCNVTRCFCAPEISLKKYKEKMFEKDISDV